VRLTFVVRNIFFTLSVVDTIRYFYISVAFEPERHLQLACGKFSLDLLSDKAPSLKHPLSALPHAYGELCKAKPTLCNFRQPFPFIALPSRVACCR